MAAAQSEPRDLRRLNKYSSSWPNSPDEEQHVSPVTSHAMSAVGEQWEPWPRTPSTDACLAEDNTFAMLVPSPGATVEVVDTLFYKYEETPQLNYELRAGLLGVVVEVDADGDSVVDWPGPIGTRWLMRDDLAKIRVHAPQPTTGAIIEVVETLVYRYVGTPELNYVLQVGLVGVVVVVDADGDLTVDWPAPIGRKWLMKADLAKVRVRPVGTEVWEPPSPTNMVSTQCFPMKMYPPQAPTPVSWWAAAATTNVALPSLVVQPEPPVQLKASSVSLPLFEYLSPPRLVGARVPLPLSEYLPPPSAEILPSALLQPRRLF